MALPIRFWNSCAICVASTSSDGQDIRRDLRSRFLQATFRLLSERSRTEFRSVRLKALALGAYPGVSQQIDDQGLHARSSVAPRRR